MTNLVISNACNLSCAYCFARDFLNPLESGAAGRHISLEAFASRLDFLSRSQIDDVRMIGGEPSLHPQFPELVQMAQARLPRLVVFSNGLIPGPALEALADLPEKSVTVLVNACATGQSGSLSESEQARRDHAVTRLGRRALVSYTISSPIFDGRFLFSLIRKTGCRPEIRLGVAQPAQLGKNTWLHPKQYTLAGESIAAFARQAAAESVKVEMDCGFVRCMFSPAAMATLEETGLQFASHCSPVMDISIDNQVCHCFPLAGRFDVPFEPGAASRALYRQLEEKAAPFRAVGVFPECSTCSYKLSGECSGGCLSPTLQRFCPAEFRLRLPAEAARSLMH